MFGLLIPVILAVALALAGGGSLAGWGHVRIRWWPAAVTCLLLLLVLYNPPLDRQQWAIEWGPWCFVGTHVVLLAVVLRNALAGVGAGARWAFALAALGVAANLAVVLANGGYMPQSAEAHQAVWGDGRPMPQGRATQQLKNTIVLDADSRLAWLADTVAQPAWLPKANVVSIGDLVLAAGLACWAFQVTSATRRRPVEHHQLSGAS